jgi:phosphomannomutase
MRGLKIGIAGVRGVVGDALSPELAVNFACAFGSWCDGGTVVIGRDTRRSSSMLRAAACSGLASTGCDVIDLGVCPTPLVSYTVRECGAAGGLSISGSHNDARWNALKFLGANGALLNAAQGEELLDIYHASAFLSVSWDGLRPVRDDAGIAARYVEKLLAALDAAAIRRRRFRVAVDFCNGACTDVARSLLSALECTLLPLNDEPTGSFAHPPAPNAENMRQLAALMRCLDADLGAALNIDGDRLGLVAADGTALSEEYALPLVADRLLQRGNGAVVTNLSTSRMVEAVAEKHNARVIRAPVGEGYVVNRALAEGAALAGEGSGGVAALSAATTFDALLALGFVLEAMAVTGEPLAALVGRLPSYSMRKGELVYPPALVYKLLQDFRHRFADRTPDMTDGVRLDWPDAWLHVRASNTEPLLRIIAEADTSERADALYEEAMTYARRMAFGHGGA